MPEGTYRCIAAAEALVQAMEQARAARPMDVTQPSRQPQPEEPAPCR